jgi:hypothetical protein
VFQVWGTVTGCQPESSKLEANHPSSSPLLLLSILKRHSPDNDCEEGAIAAIGPGAMDSELSGFDPVNVIPQPEAKTIIIGKMMAR